MIHKWTVKPNETQMKSIKGYWHTLQLRTEDYLGEVKVIEDKMSEEAGIKGLEFFRSPDDGGYCGVGNADRTMKLIQFKGGK